MKQIIVLTLVLCLSWSFAGCVQQAPEATQPPTQVTTTPPPTEVTTTPPPTTEPKIYAPPLRVTDGRGELVELADYLGTPVVLNFWASWCPPCKMEMPHFEAAYQAYPQIQFMMVNLLAQDLQADVDQVLADGGYTFPVFYDTTGEAAYIYGVSSIPMTVFIAADGSVTGVKVGALSAQQLEEEIQKLL